MQSHTCPKQQQNQLLFSFLSEGWMNKLASCSTNVANWTNTPPSFLASLAPSEDNKIQLAAPLKATNYVLLARKWFPIKG